MTEEIDLNNLKEKIDDIVICKRKIIENEKEQERMAEYLERNKKEIFTKWVNEENLKRKDEYLKIIENEGKLLFVSINEDRDKKLLELQKDEKESIINLDKEIYIRNKIKIEKEYEGKKLCLLKLNEVMKVAANNKKITGDLFYEEYYNKMRKIEKKIYNIAKKFDQYYCNDVLLEIADLFHEIMRDIYKVIFENQCKEVYEKEYNVE
jgi:hypothetical protein